MDCDIGSVKEALFFPDKTNEKKLIDYIQMAKKELLICIYTFTHKELAKAILD